MVPRQRAKKMYYSTLKRIVLYTTDRGVQAPEQRGLTYAQAYSADCKKCFGKPTETAKLKIAHTTYLGLRSLVVTRNPRLDSSVLTASLVLPQQSSTAPATSTCSRRART